MKETSLHLYEFILRQCAAVAPNPWYPSTQRPADGILRADLDRALDELRLGGLIHLTEWVQVHGQGYALTHEGSQVAGNPALLERLRAWKPSRPVEAGRAETAVRRRTTLEQGD